MLVNTQVMYTKENKEKVFGVFIEHWLYIVIFFFF